MLIRPVGRDSAQSNSFPNGTLLDWRHRFYLMEAGAYWMFIVVLRRSIVSRSQCSGNT